MIQEVDPHVPFYVAVEGMYELQQVIVAAPAVETGVQALVQVAQFIACVGP